MDRTGFESLMHFIAPTLRREAVVAGGYAVDPSRATDIDVFTLWRPLTFMGIPLFKRTIEADQDTLLKHLEDLDVDFERNELEPYGEHRYLVATVFHAYEGKSLQIIATDYSTPLQLVDSFDLSVHALAKHYDPVDAVMRLTFGTNWTPIGAPIRILRNTTPDETRKRLAKLMRRYDTGIAIVYLPKVA